MRLRVTDKRAMPPSIAAMSNRRAFRRFGFD
jgi:hypothetical protein